MNQYNFKNIICIRNQYYVKFLGSKIYNKRFDDLNKALEYRNGVYKKGIFPKFLLIEKIPLKRLFSINTYFIKGSYKKAIQVNLRCLSTYKFDPKLILINGDIKKSVSEANLIYYRYSFNLNLIIELYNQERLRGFIELANQELKMLSPVLSNRTVFDYKLWYSCYLGLKDKLIA